MRRFEQPLQHLRLVITGLALLPGIVSSIALASDSILADSHALELAQFHHIPFDDIPANRVDITTDTIVIDVDRSASFLVQGLRQIQPVQEVSVEWSANGRPSLDDAEHEADKSGDDAALKVALMLSGEPSGFSWFLPDWILEVRKKLFHPADEMLYLVAESRHAAGTSWPNPYNDNIIMYAMTDEDRADGMRRSSYRFSEPVDAVAVWLMADGDNTGASFTTTIKRIELR